MKIFSTSNKETKINEAVIRDSEGNPIQDQPAEEKKKHDFKKIAKRVGLAAGGILAAGLVILKAVALSHDDSDSADIPGIPESVPFDADAEIKEDEVITF